MPHEQVVELEGSAAHLGVEVQSARLKAAVLDDFHHRECGGIRISRHLVSIPAKKGVALVGVDAAQLPVDAAVAQLMLEGVTGKGRVVGFDIELEEGVEVVAAQEGKCVRGIEIILVLRRLEGLGLDEELPCEPDLVSVVDGHVKEARHIVLLQTIVCVEQGLIPLTATPEDIVLSTEALADLQHMLDLSGGERKDVGVAGAGHPMDKAGVAAVSYTHLTL